MLEECVIANALRQNSFAVYDQTRKQTVVLEDGKPLFAWEYPQHDASSLSAALLQFYPLVKRIRVATPFENGKYIARIGDVAHVYEVVELEIIY